jgi:hypothetical protein
MMSSTRAFVSAAACAAAAALTGCGAGHASKPAPHRSTGSLPPSGPRAQPAGTVVVSIPELGSLSYRCAGARRVDATLSTAGASATESATVEGDNHRHLRAATLNPGSLQLAAPPATYRTLTWRVIQSTEPRTLEATVRLSFSWGKDRYCSLAHWSSTVNVIGHQGPWATPRAWP